MTALLVALGVLAGACGVRGSVSSAPTTAPGATTGATSGSAPTGSQANLTGSDVGITPTTVSIAALADVGGPVPGLFETSKDAMVAFVAYVNANGGVDGRKLKLDFFDTAISASNFQIDTQQACSRDFAMVGSYSIADNGGVKVGSQCGIPDVPAAITAPQAGAADNVVSPLPSQPNLFSTGYFKWLGQQYPDAVKKAAILYPDNPTTKVAAARVVGTAKSAGFDWIYNQEVALIQPSFTSFIVAMRNKGVKLLSWGADYQAMGRILQADQQQGWRPQVFDGSATGYSQAFLQQSGSQANNMLISLPIALFSDAGKVPMMKTYLTWLDRAVPHHAPPDIFGVSAWSAGLLFVDAMRSAGPNPTRSKVLSVLRGIHKWTGDGIQAPTDPGRKLPSQCFDVVGIKSGRFVRVHPTAAGTFDCSGHLYTVPGIPPASAGG